MKNQQAKIKSQSGLIWLWLTVIILLLDYVSKWAVVKHLVYHEPKQIFPGFNLFLAYNKGAAFSFLQTENGWQVWLFSIIAIVFSIVILWVLYRTPARRGWYCAAFAFILAGALGNLIDRVAYGYVIDFIQVYYKHWYFPTFNIADSAITVGAVILILDIIIRPSPPQPSAPS